MKILVTGSSGFIGQHVINEIENRGLTPVLFDRYLKSKSESVFLGDVRDYEAVREAVGRVDGVINLAGILGTQETIKEPVPSVQTNILGALNVFKACVPTKFHQVKAVQIGVGNYFMNNSYSITKDTAVRFALMFNKEHGARIAVVRALNAYGPGQKVEPVRKVIPFFILRALAGEDIEIYGDGEQIMDMIYVKDLARALVDAVVLEHDFYNEVMDFGTGRRTTVNWIAEQVIKACDSKSKVVHLPMRPGETEGSVVLADLDTYKLPKFDLVTFEEGIKDTVSYYKDLL